MYKDICLLASCTRIYILLRHRQRYALDGHNARKTAEKIHVTPSIKTHLILRRRKSPIVPDYGVTSNPGRMFDVESWL